MITGKGSTVRSVVLALLALTPCTSTHAAELDGVAMPGARVVDGAPVRLNGIGLRTYSIFGIHIYVAGLYLERRSDDPDSILHSPERKLLDIRFLRDVNAEDARQAWKNGFESNCRPPQCRLDPRDVQRFLDAVPPMHKGDQTILLFTPKGVDVTLNGKQMGDITDPHFAETMLATFIGPAPPTHRLKRELLGEHP
jgi:hypothetical protein